MEIRIQECQTTVLETYEAIPIAFRVDSVFDVKQVDGGLGGLLMEDMPVSEPYIKDYDAISNEGPTQWAKRFDLSKWGFSLALVDDTPVGATAVAHEVMLLWYLDL